MIYNIIQNRRWWQMLGKVSLKLNVAEQKAVPDARESVFDVAK